MTVEQAAKGDKESVDVTAYQVKFEESRLAESESKSTVSTEALREFNAMVTEKEIFTSDVEREKYEWAHLYANPLYHLSLKIIAIHFPIEKRQSFLQKHHMQYDHLEKAIIRIQNKTPIITSEDLRKAGVKNGPKMGDLLKEGERIAINEGLEDPQKILSKLTLP